MQLFRKLMPAAIMSFFFIFFGVDAFMKENWNFAVLNVLLIVLLFILGYYSPERSEND